jgi:hypothetical protein
MALKRRFRWEMLEQAVLVETSPAVRISRGGSLEMTKLSWRR